MTVASRETRWPPVEVTRNHLRLVELGELLEDAMRKGESELVSGWLARLLVVRSCGYLEQVVAEVARGFILKRSGGLVRSFAHAAIPAAKNPWPESLLDWVGRFDRSLQDDLRDVFDEDDQRLRRELGLLVDRRNKIAHGLNEGVTERKALNLQIVACEVADWFVLRFNPQRA